MRGATPRLRGRPARGSDPIAPRSRTPSATSGPWSPRPLLRNLDVSHKGAMRPLRHPRGEPMCKEPLPPEREHGLRLAGRARESGGTEHRFPDCPGRRIRRASGLNRRNNPSRGGCRAGVQLLRAHAVGWRGGAHTGGLHLSRLHSPDVSDARGPSSAGGYPCSAPSGVIRPAEGAPSKADGGVVAVVCESGAARRLPC